MRIKQKISAFIRLTRIHHAIMTVLAVIAGVISSISIKYVFHYSINILLGSIVAVLVEISVFIFNDIFNLEEDKINDPNKPLVKKEISLKEAKIYGILSLFLSIILSYLINLPSFILIIIAVSTGMAYNISLKKYGIIGNIIVAFNTALPFYYGCLLTNTLFKEEIFIFFIIAFFTSLGREIIKDIMDITGDRKAGIKSLPNTIGPKKSGYIASIFIILAVCLSYLPLKLVKNLVGYISLIIPTDIIFIYTSYSIVQNPSIKNATKLRKITLLAMFLGILGFTFSNI